MSAKELLERFEEAAANPRRQMDRYLAEGRKVILTAPVYTPEELAHALGMVPMGVWGADTELGEAKRYFPAFICSIVQSITELGIRGAYQGASGILIPSLCDSLKVLGENWKYAVPEIPFIPMIYPQNRKTDFGKTFTLRGYERVAAALEKIAGEPLSPEKLAGSIAVYNAHNEAMRQAARVMADHPEINAKERSAVFKSAHFMRKEEHTELVRELIAALDREGAGDNRKIRIVTTGILANSPSLLGIIDRCGLQIVADDVAAESRQYRTDTEQGENPMECLAGKYCAMDNCSVLYDAGKKRIGLIVEMAKEMKADGILMVLTKFCDPEEFDYPLLKRACEDAGISMVQVEVDRQMDNYEQAATVIETWSGMLRA